MTTGDKDFLSGDVSGMEEMVKLYVGAIRSVLDAIPADLGQGDPAPGTRQEILMLLAKAQIAWLTSGLRYWKHIAEIVGKSGLGLLDLATQNPPKDADDDTKRAMQQLVLIDKARACLREIGEASMSEAEALRRELTKIEKDLRATQDPGPGPKGKRMHRGKT